jgi:hypothetical protein
VKRETAAWGLAIALMTGHGSAQEERLMKHTVSDRVPLAPGVVHERTNEQRPGGAMILESLSVEPAEFRGSLDMVFSRDGETSSLDKMLRESAALAGFGFATRDSTVVIANGRLMNWPIEGPCLVIDPEGTARLIGLRDQSFSVLGIDDSTTIAMQIGREPAPGAAARYIPGPLKSPELPRWIGAEDVPFIALPPEGGTDPLSLESILGSGGEVPLRFEAMASRQIDIAANGGLLVVPKSFVEKFPPRLAQLEVHVTIPPDADSVRFAMRAGYWLMRNREDIPSTRTDDGESLARNALVCSADTGRLVVISSPRDERGEFGATRAELLEYARSMRGTDAVEFPPGDSMLHPGAMAKGLRADREATGMLAILPRPWRLSVGGGGLQRIAMMGFAFEGVREIPAHPYRALWDMRTSGGADLSSVWAAKFTKDGVNDAVLLLRRRARIGAIDIIHAERAGFSPEMNVKSARFYVRDGPDKDWVLAGEFDNATPRPRQRVVLAEPQWATQIRLEVIEPNFIPGADTMRVAEVIVWGEELQ